MAGNIKGITIEIGGDTTGLDKALRGVNSQIKDTQKELKAVDKALKLDPGNTELLEQKQRRQETEDSHTVKASQGQSHKKLPHMLLLRLPHMASWGEGMGTGGGAG